MGFRRTWAYLFSGLTVFTTVVASYEVLSANRHAPHLNHAPFLAYEINACTYDPGEHSELHDFLLSNIENVVYLNLLIYEGCEGDAPLPDDAPIPTSYVIGLSPDLATPSADVELTINDHNFRRSLLTFLGEPGADVNAERFRGLVYLRGEIEAGVYLLEALPVPLTNDMLRKRICSESLAWASGTREMIEAYVRSCIFEQPLDPWGWSSRG